MSDARLPTLKSLAAFEATARLGTISSAADELHVTHSAISQNIKQLEDQLGHQLFTRRGRTLAPTENALLFLADIRIALDRIREATHAFKLSEEPNQVTLKMVGTLALRWFIPKLPELKALHPSLSLRLMTEPVSSVANLPDEVDAAIGIGSEHEFAGLYHLRLHTSELILVGLEPTAATVDEALATHPALYVESPRRAADWPRWCSANRIPEPDATRRIMLPTSAQALEAVSSGVGVLVTQRIFVEQLLELKHLAQIDRGHTIESEGYYFYCRPHQMERTAIRTLHDWLASTSL